MASNEIGCAFFQVPIDFQRFVFVAGDHCHLHKPCEHEKGTLDLFVFGVA